MYKTTLAKSVNNTAFREFVLHIVLCYSFISTVESKSREIQMTQELPQELDHAINTSLAYVHMMLSELCMLAEPDAEVVACIPKDEVTVPSCDLVAVPNCVSLGTLTSAVLRQDYDTLCE